MNALLTVFLIAVICMDFANLLMCYVCTSQASKDQCLEASRCVRNETVCITPTVKINVGESHGRDLYGLLPPSPAAQCSCVFHLCSQAVSVLVGWGLKCSPLLGLWETQISLGYRSNLICLRKRE